MQIQQLPGGQGARVLESAQGTALPQVPDEPELGTQESDRPPVQRWLRRAGAWVRGLPWRLILLTLGILFLGVQLVLVAIPVVRALSGWARANLHIVMLLCNSIVLGGIMIAGWGQAQPVFRSIWRFIWGGSRAGSEMGAVPTPSGAPIPAAAPPVASASAAAAEKPSADVPDAISAGGPPATDGDRGRDLGGTTATTRILPLGHDPPRRDGRYDGRDGTLDAILEVRDAYRELRESLPFQMREMVMAALSEARKVPLPPPPPAAVPAPAPAVPAPAPPKPVPAPPPRGGESSTPPHTFVSVPVALHGAAPSMGPEPSVAPKALAPEFAHSYPSRAPTPAISRAAHQLPDGRWELGSDFQTQMIKSAPTMVTKLDARADYQKLKAW